ADVAELAHGVAGAGSDDAELLAVVRVDAETVIVAVADDEVAFPVKGKAAGPALAVVGRGPGDAQVMAVEVVGLDAGGEIDDVEAVLAVDDRGARPGQVAVADALLAPDQLGARGRAATARQTEGGEDEQGVRTDRQGHEALGCGARRDRRQAITSERGTPE